jgi:hypothetical protein
MPTNPPFNISYRALRDTSLWTQPLRARLTPSSYTFDPTATTTPTGTLGTATTSGGRIVTPRAYSGWFTRWPNAMQAGDTYMTYWNIVIDLYLPDETNVLSFDQYSRALDNYLGYLQAEGRTALVQLPHWDANTSPPTFTLESWWPDLIDRFDGHPALRGWYMLDEPELQGELPGDTRPIFTHEEGMRLYNIVKSRSNTDVYVVFAVTTWFTSKYRGRTPFWDVFMFDFYPWLTQTEVDARELVNPLYDYTINTQGELDFIRANFQTWLPIVAEQPRVVYVGQGFGGTQTAPITEASQTAVFPAYRAPNASQFEYVESLLSELFPRIEGLIYWDYLYSNGTVRALSNDSLRRWRDERFTLYLADPITFVSPTAGTYGGALLETLAGVPVAWIGFASTITGTGADVRLTAFADVFARFVRAISYGDWVRSRAEGVAPDAFAPFAYVLRQSTHLCTFADSGTGVIRSLDIESQYRYLWDALNDVSPESTERSLDWTASGFNALTDGFGTELDVIAPTALRSVPDSTHVCPFTWSDTGVIYGFGVPQVEVVTGQSRSFASDIAPVISVARSGTSAVVSLEQFRVGYALRLFMATVEAGVYGRYEEIATIIDDFDFPYTVSGLDATKNYKFKAVWTPDLVIISPSSKPEISVNYLL